MLTPAERTATNLDTKLRELLIAHAQGPQPVILDHSHKTRVALMRRGLIRHHYMRGASAASYPKHTEFTDDGRQVACVILGQYADQLVASIEFLQKIAAPPSAPVLTPASRELQLAANWARAAATVR